MKRIYKATQALAAAALLAVGAWAMASCQDDVDAPRVDVPVAKDQPNTTIFELKQAFWDDAVNYIDTIGTKEDGSHYIIHGRVVSSDEAGNIFKSIVIQDETAALAISINSYNLYLKYRVGQEIVLDCTGMYIGKYNGLQQLGMPEWYENGNAWEASFMSPQFFQSHAQLNGLPDPAKIDTITVNSFSELPTDPQGLMKWQSQLVRFNNVKFVNGGSARFSEYHSRGVNQGLTDAEGTATLQVRTSGYSNFWNNTLPQGYGDVVCILSYYGTTGWQLMLNDIEGCMNFGNPTVAPGSETKPWTVAQAIELEQAGTQKSGWVTGYIVGAVAPEVTSVTSNADIEWTSQPVLANTLVIGATPQTNDIKECLVIGLPAGSKLRQYGNLVDNPGVYGKAIDIRGTLAKYMDTYGITGNSGANGTFRIEGVDTGDAPVAGGDGTRTSPYNCAQVIAMNPQSSSEAVTGGSGVWVNGYIVGWADMSTTFYINAETARFAVPATMATNILVADNADETNYAKCIGIQLPAGAVRTALNLVDNPGNLGAKVALKGDIMKYSGVPGMKNTAEYAIDGATPPTPPTPAEAVTTVNENFDASTTIPAGWTQAQLAGNKSWYVPTFNGNNYAAMTGYKGTAPFDQWLITPPLDMDKMARKQLTFDTQVNGYGATTTALECYVLSSADPATATRTRLNPALATAPASGYSDWKASGTMDLSQFTGTVYVAWRYTATQDANYATWCVDNVLINADGNGGDNPGGDDPNPPTPPTGQYKGDFNTFNNGEAKASPYGTYTNATGWTATNAIILGGSDEAPGSNPYFSFIGPKGTLAPTLNGKAGACGTLTSPLLTGGIKTLTFQYGFAFTDTKGSFTVNIKDAAGNIVKTDTVTPQTITKATAMSYTLAVNVTGDFIIEIVNNGPSASTSNKDRVSIWNLTWD